MRRLLAVVLLAAGLLAAGASAASAASLSPGGPTLKPSLTPNLPGVASLPDPLGPFKDSVCPPRQPPYPASPSGIVWKRGGGPGMYANYDYAGLEWTTYDTFCLTQEWADTSLGSHLNSIANSMDQLTNELQVTALDQNTTASLDRVMVKALSGLRAAFWSKWSLIGVAAAGLVLVLLVASGQMGAMVGILVRVSCVVAVVALVTLRPTLPSELSDKLTTSVATGVADTLMAVTPQGSLPASATPTQKFGEGFYQVSYRAWLDGSFCGDEKAAATYGRRLLDAQAFTVSEATKIEKDAGLGDQLVKSKGDAWLKIGEELASSNPVGFGCWKGAGQSRLASAVKHMAVSVGAGFWVILGSLGLLALKWVLRLALLFLMTFGAFALASERMAGRLTKLVMLGLIGPPFVAAAVGTLLWGYYAILLDTSTAWWQAGVSAFALGLAVWLCRGILAHMFVGAREVDRSGMMLGRSGRRGRRYSRRYARRHGSRYRHGERRDDTETDSGDDRPQPADGDGRRRDDDGPSDDGNGQPSPNGGGDDRRRNDETVPSRQRESARQQRTASRGSRAGDSSEGDGRTDAASEPQPGRRYGRDSRQPTSEAEDWARFERDPLDSDPTEPLRESPRGDAADQAYARARERWGSADDRRDDDS